MEGEWQRVIVVQLPRTMEHIQQLRRFATDYCKLAHGPDVAGRVELVSHELLENAFKYGTVGGQLSFSLSLTKGGGAFEIRVDNEALPSRVEILQRQLERLSKNEGGAGFLDDLVGFTDGRMAMAQLGLRRVKYEGRVELELKHEGRRVSMLARGQM